MLAGFVAPFLPGFLFQVLFGVDVYGDNPGAWIGLAMLLTVPGFGLFGALLGMRLARRS
jgi:hypothetical protein